MHAIHEEVHMMLSGAARESATPMCKLVSRIFQDMRAPCMYGLCKCTSLLSAGQDAIDACRLQLIPGLQQVMAEKASAAC